MDKLISVIIPVYNTSSFINKCVESVLNQTHKNIEILLINDGSTDNSDFVCKALQKKDSRIRYYYKTNGGLSSARNYGLDRITGDYVSFIDSDDLIDKNFIYSILQGCIKYDALIGMSGRVMFNDNLRKDMFTLPEIQLWSSEVATSRFLKWDNIDGSVCDKIFHISLFSNRRFPEGRISEDLPVFVGALIQAGNIVHIGKPMYYYFQREGSITNSKFSSDKISILDSASEVFNVVMLNFPNLKFKANFYFVSHILLLHYLIKNEIDSFNEEWRLIRKAISNKLFVSFINPHLSFKQKILLFLIYSNLIRKVS